MAADPFVALATLGAPHGVRGAIKLTSLTNPPAKFAEYASLSLADGTAVRLQVVGGGAPQFIVQIDGVTDRNAAERWRGKQLGVPSSVLPELSNDSEFYHAELIGMQVVHASGQPYGTVANVVNYGAGDILEIARNGATELYSFTQANFPTIDRTTRRIEFHPPELLVAGKAE